MGSTMIDLSELKTEETPEESIEEVTTAFLVVLHKNGQWSAHADLDISIIPDRQAHFDDFVGGSANVSQSCMVQQTAMHTMVMMNQQAQAVQQRMMAEQEAQRVSSLIDPKKLRNRG
jgi:peroxiredoxin